MLIIVKTVRKLERLITYLVLKGLNDLLIGLVSLITGEVIGKILTWDGRIKVSSGSSEFEGQIY